MDIVALVLQAVWFILPAYFANSSPVLARKIFGRHNAPIDSGKSLADGERVLGDGKTWAGLIFGISVAALVGVIQHAVQIAFSLDDFTVMTFGLAALLGFGALFGDIVKSFIKRRLGLQRGKPWFPFDQLDFVLGAFLFSIVLVPFNWQYLVVLLILTPAVHLAANYAAFKLKLKKEPW